MRLRRQHKSSSSADETSEWQYLNNEIVISGGGDGSASRLADGRTGGNYGWRNWEDRAAGVRLLPAPAHSSPWTKA
ncbi:hypothetical protein B5S33_g212 [[Candida] boidinii]|nr:hypothetical protein B5S30_g3602 [[Candida] boidinii]OWB81593.1 hypothetical protein B5S33_g212 [[Candida] boidinii]